jgi:hypothetical protein
MRKLYGSLISIMLLSFVLTQPGCVGTKLDPSGPYQGDVLLYHMEKDVPAAKKTLDALLKIETTNAATLAQWPEIKQACDEIRRNGKAWFTAANLAHDEYVAAKDAFKKAKDDAEAAAAAAQLDQAAAALNMRLAVINEGVKLATSIISKYKLNDLPR